MMAQDRDPGFRAAVVEYVNRKEHRQATMVIGEDSLMTPPQQANLSIVVFVAANQVSAKAVNTALYLAR